MFTYKLDEVKKMGEMDEKYGQSYWCTSSSELKPLKFNSMNQDIKAGDIINAEESVNKRSAKGTDYLQLRKVKLSEAEYNRNPASSVTLESIDAKLDKIIELITGEEKVPEVNTDEPINLDDIPF